MSILIILMLFVWLIIINAYALTMHICDLDHNIIYSETGLGEEENRGFSYTA